MAYGLYRGNKIRKIVGNPRSAANQKGVIVWAETKAGVKQWIMEFGTPTQKRLISQRRIVKKRAPSIKSNFMRIF